VSTESPFLGLPGAVSSIAPGAVSATAAHFGDPVSEQRMLAAGRAIVDLSDRGVVTVTGDDRLTWLDSLTSQSLDRLEPGQSAETLLLDPKGRLEHSIRVVDDGTATWLLVDGEQAAPLAAWLDRMRFMKQVEVADVSAEWATIGQLQPEGAELLVVAAAPNGVPLVWSDPWVGVQAGGWQYASTEAHPGHALPAREVLIERPGLVALAAKVGAGAEASPLRVAGSLALDALRIAAWRPRQSDVDDRTIPHEFDWLRSAVHLSKGCYRGQETVAKVHNLGHPPRRLVMLHLDGSLSLLPAPGSPVLSSDAEVGHVTASARHHELGPIALAIVKRSLPVDAPLVVTAAVPGTDGALTAEVASIAAAQELIVPPEAGATAGVPRLPRLGAVRR
jgi:tRNA-modifying protein YgfZ